MNTVERYAQTLEMQAAYERGNTLRMIAEHYGMTIQGVSFRLRQCGTKMRANGNRGRAKVATQFIE